MINKKVFALVAFTLCSTAIAVTVPHQYLHQQTKVVPHQISPISYKPKTSAYPASNPTYTSTQGTKLSPTSISTQSNTPNSQSPMIGYPHSIANVPQQVGCVNGKVWDTRALKCACPAEKPYTDLSGQCVSCQAPLFWVAKLSKCMTCPQGFVSDKVQGRCYCPKDRPYLDKLYVCQQCNTVWDYKTKSCLVCDNDKSFNFKSRKCECEKEYFEDITGKCESCPSPATWDLKNKKCVRCPQGFTFDQASSQCGCPNEKPYLNANNLCQSCNGQWDETKLSCKECQIPKTWNAKVKKCECQGDNHDDGTGKCVLCAKPAAWDFGNKKCVRCPLGLEFDLKSSQCACPAEKPYLDINNYCQACKTKWDTIALKCQVCVFGTTWNNSIQKCVEKCPYPLINGKCQCPSDKPLLDQATQECKACDSKTPVWNGKQCKVCPANTHYVAAGNICASCVQGMAFNQGKYACQLIV